MFNRHTTPILLSATLLLAAIPVAANAADAHSVQVNAGDLNLDSSSGRAVLRARIDQAVVAVCGDTHTRTTWALRAQAISCTKTARDGAMTQFDGMVAAAQSGRKVAADITMPVR